MLKRVQTWKAVSLQLPASVVLHFVKTSCHLSKRQYLPHTSDVVHTIPDIAFLSHWVDAIPLCFLALMYKSYIGASAGHLEFG